LFPDDLGRQFLEIAQHGNRQLEDLDVKGDPTPVSLAGNRSVPSNGVADRIRAGADSDLADGSPPGDPRRRIL